MAQEIQCVHPSGSEMPMRRGNHGRLLFATSLTLAFFVGYAGAASEARANAAAAQPDSSSPQLLGAQYTYVLQHQTALRSPYAGRLSLDPQGDTQPTHTIGLYGGWAPARWAQLYLDTEKFMGAGVSGATGLGGEPNGEVVRQGSVGLKKTFYIARVYVRLIWPLGGAAARVTRAQDQIAGSEATRRLEFKAGRMAVTDDFDHNRYAAATRTQFMNWSLWANSSWDYPANTRGSTDGLVLAFIDTTWALRYGIYRMPLEANGQTLETLRRAQGQSLELTLASWQNGAIVRLLAFRNTARMGDYRAALATARSTGMLPDITADRRDGRHKYGFGINGELPLADEGETGLFVRLGANDGTTEAFAFTEVDREVSAGVQVSGVRWGRSDDRFGAAVALQGLAGAHRDYLAAGGVGFMLGDGQLDYAHEQIFESYYRLQLASAVGRLPLRVQLSPDFQYIRNPGFNRARGPVRFYGLRLHLEY